MDDDLLLKELKRFRSFGYKLFFATILLGILGAIIVHWSVILIAIVVGIIIGKVYSNDFYNSLSAQTGMGKAELKQELARVDVKRRVGA